MTHPKYHRFFGDKLLRFTDSHLIPIAEGKKPYPIDWHVYPSNVCNHKCTWCMFRQNGEQFDFRVKLARPVLMKAVHDAARTGAKHMHFSGGGEPLLNKHTLEAMQLAGALGLEVSISTNGRLLTPEVAAAAHNVRVSLNAGTKKQHWKTNHGSDLRDPGDWEVILENVKRCVPHKRRDFGLGYVVDFENWKDIYKFCAVAVETGVDFVHIRPGFYYEAEKDQLTRECMPKAFKLCEKAKADFGDKVNIFSLSSAFDGYWTPRSYSKCHAVWTGITLRATGDFAVCQDRTDLVFGKNPNYAMGATFEEVWHSDERQRVTNSICTGQELDKCPRCVWNGRNTLIHNLDEIRPNLV